MKKANYLLIVMAAALMSSCAKDVPTVDKGYHQESFEAWMRNNEPGAVKVGNIYIKYIERNANPSAYRVKVDTSWVMMNYTGRTLDGDVFITRSESVAHRIGIWRPNVHYSDDFRGVSASDNFFNLGIVEGLQNMNEGDSARIFFPGKVGFTTNISEAGYGGNQYNYVGFPAMMDIRLKYITSNPYRFEMDSLAKFARSQWGQEPRDTISFSIYMKKVKENPTGDPITKDSNVRIFYEQYFLDDFPLDTNNDSIAREMGIYDEEKSFRYESLYFRPFETGYEDVFSYAALNMRRGEVADVVVISARGTLANKGNSASSPAVVAGPYTPSRYRIYVLRRGTLTIEN